MNETIKQFEDKLRIQKEEYGQQIRDTIERMSTDKEISDKKYEQKRKALKELEANINKHMTKIEREKAVLSEKCKNIEFKKSEMEKRFEDQIKSAQDEIAKLKEMGSKDKTKRQN